MEKQNKPILDVCCGSRMFWFDKENPLALFTDIRDFEDTLCDGRKISVKPDKIEDCTNLSLGLLAHFTQIYHLYNLLIYNILRRNLQLFITEFCIFSPCIIFISNKNSDKSIEILHISPKYITSVDNLMIHIFSSTFNFLYSFTPSDRLESKS